MEHKGTVTLVTDRLILRRLTVADAPAMYKNWANDEKVTKFLTWQPHQSPAHTRDLLKSWEMLYASPKTYQWAIELKSICQPIGTISAVGVHDEINAVTVGYCIGSRWWQQGITSEALSAVKKFFFEEVKINRLEARHSVHNPNSGKVMKRCGLSYEGTLKQADKSNFGITDLCVYAMTADEYFER